MSRMRHILVVAGALFLLLGVPVLYYVDVGEFFSGATDAVTQASMVLPDQPSGEFVVLMNETIHQDTIEQWDLFFQGEDAGVIMSDIRCMVVDADQSAIQLAERFQARLAENQMQIRREDGLLLASRAENQLFDVIILSREMAEAYSLQSLYTEETVHCITVKGE